MDILLHRRCEGPPVDRGPARFCSHAGDIGHLARLLRRDQVDDVALVLGAELGDDGLARDIDLGYRAVLFLRDPFDHRSVDFLPALHEQGHLGKLVLGIDDQDLRLRLLGLEIVGDHAGPFVRPGRAAERVAGRRQNDDPAVFHRLKLLAQQNGLRAGFPGMRDLLRRRRIVALDLAPLEIDARRQDQLVPADRGAAGGRHRFLGMVDPGDRVVHDLDAALRHRVEAVTDRSDVAQAAQHQIAERAGVEGLVRLDQRHLDRVAAEHLGVFRRAGAAEAAADHDDSAALALGHSRGCERRRRGAGHCSKLASCQSVHVANSYFTPAR